MTNAKFSVRGQAMTLGVLCGIWCIFLNLPPGKDAYFPWRPFIEPIFPFAWPFAFLLLVALGFRLGIKEFTHRAQYPYSYYFGILFSALPLAVLASFPLGIWITVNEISKGSYYYYGSPEYVPAKWAWMTVWTLATLCVIGIGYFLARYRIWAIFGLLSLLLLSASTLVGLSGLCDVSLQIPWAFKIREYWALLNYNGLIPFLLTAIPASILARKEARQNSVPEHLH